MTNRKSPIGFPIRPRSMPLDDSKHMVFVTTLKTGTPITHSLGKVPTNFGCLRLICFWVRSTDRRTDWQNSGWPFSSHYQIPWLFQTFQVNIYRVSTLPTVAIQNELHVISHCNTHYSYILPQPWQLCSSVDSNGIIHYSSPPSLRSRPPKSALGEHCKLSQWGLQKSNLVHFRYDTIYYLHWKTDRQAASLICTWTKKKTNYDLNGTKKSRK